MTCIGCGGALEAGFIPDFGHGATWVAVWVSGTPDRKKGFWETLRTGAGVATAGSEVRTLEAHRCRKCGRVELYANQPAERAISPAAKGD